MNILQKVPWFVWPLIILFLWFAPKYIFAPNMIEAEGRVVKDTRTSGEDHLGRLYGRSWWTVAFTAPDGNVYQKQVLGFSNRIFSKKSGHDRIEHLRQMEGEFLKSSSIGLTVPVFYPEQDFENFDIRISDEQSMPKIATHIRWAVGISLLVSAILVGIKWRLDLDKAS